MDEFKGIVFKLLQRICRVARKAIGVLHRKVGVAMKTKANCKSLNEGRGKAIHFPTGGKSYPESYPEIRFLPKNKNFTILFIYNLLI